MKILIVLYQEHSAIDVTTMKSLDTSWTHRMLRQLDGLVFEARHNELRPVEVMDARPLGSKDSSDIIELTPDNNEKEHCDIWYDDNKWKYIYQGKII